MALLHLGILLLCAFGHLGAMAKDQSKEIGPSDDVQEEQIDSILTLARDLMWSGNYTASDSILSIEEARVHEIGYRKGQARAYLLRALLEFRTVIPFDRISTNLLKSLKIYEELNDSAGIEACYLQLGVVNYTISNYVDGAKDLRLSLKWGGENGQLAPTARYLLGLCYSETGQYEKATELLNNSLQDYAAEDPQRQLYVRTFLGKLYCNKGKYTDGAEQLEYAISEFPYQKDLANLAVARSFLSTAYLHLGEMEKARFNAEFTMRHIDLSSGIMYWLEASRSLHQIYAKLGMMNKAYETMVAWQELADSVSGAQVLERITTQSARYEFEKKSLSDSAEQELRHQDQLRRQARMRDIGFGSGIVALLLAIGFYSRMRFTRRAKQAIEYEKERSEALLLNILPEEVAEELKAKGESSARQFDKVSILFTDFKNFTALAEGMDADELVSELNHCFKAFDQICEEHGVEKVKTIGDSYMAASGLPVPMEDSTSRLVLAGLAMQQFMEERKSAVLAAGGTPFEMRAGIHSGRVVAGIVGVKKFQYDVWGDTVNMASRMETHGEVGKLNISEVTYHLIKEDARFTFQHRGKVQAKGKGEVDMYFVNID